MLMAAIGVICSRSRSGGIIVNRGVTNIIFAATIATINNSISCLVIATHVLDECFQSNISS
jgi:hypothetical protein